MASVIFRPAGTNSRGTQAYQAEFRRTGGLSTRRGKTGAEMLRTTPGVRGEVPRGTDTNAPRVRG